MNLVKIKKSKIPELILKSNFFNVPSDNGYYFIPQKILKSMKIVNIKNINDYKKYLSVLQFFMLSPDNILMKYHRNLSNIDEVLEYLLPLRKDIYIKNIIDDIKDFIKTEREILEFRVKLIIDFDDINILIYDKKFPEYKNNSFNYNNLPIKIIYDLNCGEKNYSLEISKNVIFIIDALEDIIFQKNFVYNNEKEDIMYEINMKKNLIYIDDVNFILSNEEKEYFLSITEKLLNRIKKIFHFFKNGEIFALWATEKEFYFKSKNVKIKNNDEKFYVMQFYGQLDNPKNLNIIKNNLGEDLENYSDPLVFYEKNYIEVKDMLYLEINDSKKISKNKIINKKNEENFTVIFEYGPESENLFNSN